MNFTAFFGRLVRATDNWPICLLVVTVITGWRYLERGKPRIKVFL